MSDNTLKYIIATVIALLLVFQIGALIAGLLGMAWGIVAAVLVTGVSFFSTRLAGAGAKSSLWFLLPTLLFTIFPLFVLIWTTLNRDTGWFDRVAALTPFVVGFAVPVLLLLLVYYELRKRAQRSRAIQPPAGDRDAGRASD